VSHFHDLMSVEWLCDDPIDLSGLPILRANCFPPAGNNRHRYFVVALSHGQPIACDEVYVIVENTALTVCDGKLHVESRDHAQKPHMPIDVLFKSMAEELQQRAFGAVFSVVGPMAIGA
jgi:hypothetical protein